MCIWWNINSISTDWAQPWVFSLWKKKSPYICFWNLIPDETCTTHSGSHLEIRREKNIKPRVRPLQLMVLTLGLLEAGGCPGSPDSPGNASCQRSPGEPFWFVLAARCRLSREPQSPHLMEAAAENTPNLSASPLWVSSTSPLQTEYICTNVSSVLCKFWLQPHHLSTSSCSRELANWPLIISLTSLLR